MVLATGSGRRANEADGAGFAGARSLVSSVTFLIIMWIIEMPMQARAKSRQSVRSNFQGLGRPASGGASVAFDIVQSGHSVPGSQIKSKSCGSFFSDEIS